MTGWDLPYPETTGYLIPTLLAHDTKFPEMRLAARAHAAGAWLSRVQFDTGALCQKQHRPDNRVPSVFNTGMGVHGWVSLAERGDAASLESAARAAEFLISAQDSDGAWRRHAYGGVPHTYYTMVDWALLRLHRLSGATRHRDAAYRHLEWTLGQQSAAGWFEHAAFSAHEPATTHTLSYVTQGLVECAQLSGDERFAEAAERATRPLFALFGNMGRLPGPLSREHRPLADWECLTGSAQTALVWIALSRRSGDPAYAEAARRLVRRVRCSQRIGTRDPSIDGAIPGSAPLRGSYDRFAFPNHAAKFYVDAIEALAP
jgi:uncharacterized protein YyaL (SSP411 family)